MINNSTTKGSVCNRKKVGLLMDDRKSCLLTTRDHNCNQKEKEDKNVVRNVKAGQENYQLLSFHQLPDYMKDNQYIVDYYRADWPIKQAFFSLFSWHNETLNVWTHLLGFLLFLGLTAANLVDVPQVADLISMITEQFPSTSSAESNISKNSLLPGLVMDVTTATTTQILELQKQQQDDESSSRWPVYVFLCGSMFCLLSSSACHLLSCHSQRLNAQLLHMDYVGITVMIITSFFPPIYYIFGCSPHWQLVYLAAITLLGGCTVVALLSPALSSPRYRSLRAMLFVSMGLFGLVPALHALALNWHDPHRNLTLAYESGMAVSYLVGTGFYVSRIPERWWPGCFDLAGHSHQIFHVLVVAGALAHYGATQIFLTYRGGGMTTCHA